MKSKKIIPVVAVVLAGLALGMFIMRADKTSMGQNSGQESKGKPDGHGHDESKKSGEDHAAEESGKKIELSADAAAGAGIEIKTAGPGQMKTVLELPGEIGLNRNKVAHIVPRLSGVVTQVEKNLGDPVKKGEVIAVLESRELADTKSGYLASIKRVELARSTFEREERLFQKKISPEQDFLVARQGLAEAEIGLQTSRQKLLALGLSEADLKRLAESPGGAFTRYEIRAPFDGVVIEKRIAVGEAIKEDADIFVVADLSIVWGEITVYANDLNAVRTGQRVNVRSKTLGLEATGKVSYIGPLVGEQTRSAQARVDIPNPKRLWRPGLFVTVEVVQDEAPVPVAVPADAIQTVEDRSVVFVQDGEHFEPRNIRVGRSNGRWVEVAEGLSPGEKYVSRNSFVLKSEMGKEGAAHEH